jgi:NUMOD3 motif
MFYVYEHWRPDRDEPFYVGKGKGSRANLMSRRNPHHKAIQAKLHGMGMAVEVRIVAAGLTEEEAFILECDRIKMWERAGIDLANMTIGGEGPAGRRLSEEHKRKISESSKGRKNKPITQDTRKKMSEAKRGMKLRLGAKLSDETKTKISKSNKGKSKGKGVPKSEEHKKKISISVSNAQMGINNHFYGRKHTEETKAKISAAKRMKNAAR